MRTPTTLSDPLEPEKLSPEVPAVLEGREESRQPEQKSTRLWSRWPRCRLQSSLRHLDQTEPCSLPQPCPAHDITERKRDCTAQKNPIKAAAQNGSPCPARSSPPGCVTQSVTVTQTREAAASELQIGQA